MHTHGLVLLLYSCCAWIRLCQSHVCDFRELSSITMFALASAAMLAQHLSMSAPFTLDLASRSGVLQILIVGSTRLLFVLATFGCPFMSLLAVAIRGYCIIQWPGGDPVLFVFWELVVAFRIYCIFQFIGGGPSLLLSWW